MTDRNSPTTATFPGKTWDTASPTSRGTEEELLLEAVRHVREVSGENGVEEMLIVRDGAIIRQGPHVERLHRVWSCTKSFLSTCFGLLWDDGILTPDMPAKDVFPEVSEYYPCMTLEHLATLTSGYDWEENPLEPAPPMFAPGEALHDSAHSDLLAAILTRLAGRPLEDLFFERIGDPIGIARETMDWKVWTQDRGIDLNGGSGRPGGSVHITGPALARFGWLYASDGVWEGTRLISRRYIDYATVPRTSPETPPHDPDGWYVHLPGNYGLIMLSRYGFDYDLDYERDLATAKITVTLPVTRVGLRQGDYKRSFAMTKEVPVKAPGRPAKSFTLQQTTDKVQFIPYEAHTDTINIEARSIYPPRDPKAPQDRPYGGINQVQVLVSEDLDELFRIPDVYARGLPSYTMRTPNLDPQAVTEVEGEPRKATGHPCTIWDERDIARLKKQIETYPAGQEAYEEIIKFCEDAIADELSVPDEPDKGNNPKVAGRHQKVALAIGNLGIGYALSGNEKYATEAKRLLLGLADRYKDWPVHGHPKFTHDKSKWSWQRLNDAIWLIPSAWGYDLIYESESISDAERKRIEEDFIMACARFIVRGSSGSLRAPTNWSAIMCAAAMVASRTCGDEDLYRKTLYGKRGTDKDNVSGGVYFYIDNAIDDDGMWAEGAIGYQFMAMRGMLVMAETLWRDGIDVYSYNNNRLKLIFDSPIWFAYPGGHNSPAVHDSGGAR
jgi:hypothetical protein